MKEIKAFIRPQMLDAVVDALESRPETPGLTVSEVRGWGHLPGDGRLFVSPVEETVRVRDGKRKE